MIIDCCVGFLVSGIISSVPSGVINELYDIEQDRVAEDDQEYVAIHWCD